MKTKEPEQPIWFRNTLLVLIGLIFTGLLLFPAQYGGYTQFIRIEGQSMTPTYEPGNIVFMVRTKEYEVDDVVVYQAPEKIEGCDNCFIIHRIVGRNDDGSWILQGDNNDEPDRWDISSRSILGKVLVKIPL